MKRKLEVSFNSPQCGWMSIGFSDGLSEFHTTTAYTPYREALADILRGLLSLLDASSPRHEFVIHWSRNPEHYNLRFERDEQNVRFSVVEYPTVGRSVDQAETVFTHDGTVSDFCQAFYRTFSQLYNERNTDEFETNWRQPFPLEEYLQLQSRLLGVK